MLYETSKPRSHEVHITVEKPDMNNEQFVIDCKDINVKAVLIELPYGEYPKQYMTSSTRRGTFDEIMTYANHIADNFRAKAYNIIRIKFEIHAKDPLTPKTDEDAKTRRYIHNYFEFHVLLNFADTIEENMLKPHLQPLHAHLSKSALKKRSTAITKFVTLRCYCGRENAYKQYEELQRVLNNYNVRQCGNHHEYAIYDSNVDLDKNWI